MFGIGGLLGAVGEVLFALVLIHRFFPGQVTEEQWSAAEAEIATVRKSRLASQAQAIARLGQLAIATCPVMNPADDGSD